MYFQRTISAAALSLVLASCAAGPSLTQPTHTIAWDGLGRDPNLRASGKRPSASAEIKHLEDPNNERERVLATLRPYSEAWWAVRDEIDAADDRTVNSKLAICKGCFVPEQEATGSVP